MKASIVDLRYKMSDILKALERNEEVRVLYHGKVKGVIVPAKKGQYKSMVNHPFFGMLSEDNKNNVLDTLNDLRKTRYDII